MERLIGIINLSTLVSDEDCKAMAHACQQQLAEDVAPAWGMLSVGVVFYPKEAIAAIPDFVERIVVFDDADVAGAGGYHDLGPDGKPYGKIFARPVIDDGGGALTGQPWSVSIVASHEVIEQFLDPDCNMWGDGPLIAGGECYAVEGCDAVEASSYVKNGVTVSNFLYPAAFNPKASAGTKLDHMGILSQPFTLAAGGYQLVRFAPGDETEVFGEVRPAAWRLAGKEHPASRTSRRRRADQ